ncbi:hypothetical protein JCGZ_07376 [Jatropha curcas]|uniref:Histidine-containing phosphotransfer protein n=1 Tax=Jatropha curcas TaxID=180498 RepID=A0A067KNF0_JATCU|nr:pseudo histidine-containing phosphotransfer protein 2 [Jatropha curcas]KDP33805.1 hypothetical protein JCGZ_07376 [Jatropha curcas]
MENQALLQQIAAMRKSFFDEGTLDSFFVQLEQLQGPDDPNFVEEILTLFFSDSMDMLATVEEKLTKSPVDFTGINKILHQLKVNSASIGAKKVKDKVIAMRNNSKEHNVEGIRVSLQELRMEYETLKGKFEPYFELLKQAGPQEGEALPSLYGGRF